MDYFLDRREPCSGAMEAIGRDPSGFALVAQVPAGTTAAQRRVALEMGLVARRGGATHVIVGIPPARAGRRRCGRP